MTDFETRLRETLRDRAEDAPGTSGTSGLAAGARGRLRRRRTTMAGAGVLAGAVIIAPFLLNHGEPTSRGVEDIATDPTTVVESPSDALRADGLRTESWHDVTFAVPADWGHGAPTGQCFSSASVPSVGRPGDPSPSVDCAGPGYGATVGPADLYEPASGDVYQYIAPEGFEPRYPDKAWVSIWYDDEVAVTIATPTKLLTETIVASVHVIDGVDDNGCAPLLGFAESSTGDGSDGLSVCRYDESDDLEWSRRLDGDGAAGLRGLVEAAPERTVDYDCPTEEGLSRTAVLDGGAYLATVVTDAVLCEGWNGIFLSGAVREINDDVRTAIERPAPAG